MTRQTLSSLGTIVLAVAVLINQRAVGQVAAAQGPRQAPIFQVESTWLKMPNNWVMGVVTSVAVDKHDNVWLLHRPQDLPPDKKANAAPAVLEFDSSGKFLQAWGWPKTDQLWPRREHCLYVDHNDNVWIGGTWRDPGQSDDYLQKFSTNGKLLLQIGRPNASKGPRDTVNLRGAADVFVYAKTNEVFAADEGNLRVIVFDADSGKFKRMWAGTGDTPPEQLPASALAQIPGLAPPSAGRAGAAPPPAPGTPGSVPRAWGALHAARVSNDDLVYAGDRAHSRIQVFTLDGKYINQIFDAYASGLTFSSDPNQRFIYLADSPGNGIEQIKVLDRQTLTIVDRFGKEGSGPGEFRGPHSLAVDSRNNLYVAEVNPGNRVQKFVFRGLGPATSLGNRP